MSDSRELIKDRSMANADPALVGSEVRNGDATQMGANRADAEHAGVQVLIEIDRLGGIQETASRLGLLFFDLLLGESSDKNRLSVPHDLHDLPGRKAGNIDLEVAVSIVSLPSREKSNDRKRSQSGEGNESPNGECVDHVDLGPLDIGLSVCLVVHSVFLEPVVDADLQIEMILEIARSGRGHEEFGGFVNLMGSSQFLVQSIFVLLKDPESFE